MTNKEKLKKEVNEAWDMIKECSNLWGENNIHTEIARARWYGLYRAWNIMYPDEIY